MRIATGQGKTLTASGADRSSESPRAGAAVARPASATCVRWARLGCGGLRTGRQGRTRNLTGHASGESPRSYPAAAPPLACPVRTLVRSTTARYGDPRTL